MRTVVVIMVMVVVTMVRPGFFLAVAYKADAEDAGDAGRDETDDRTDDRCDEAEKGVCDQDRVRARLRSGYQEGHAGRTGRTLAAHLCNHRYDGTTAQRHGYADGRTHGNGFQAVVLEPPEDGLTGDEHVDET